jgi:tRNA(adenine34) deaminase
MVFSEQDKDFMNLSLEKAKDSYSRGDYPVGAVLVVGTERIGEGRNITTTIEDWGSHAEAVVLRTFSNALKRASRSSTPICLYTTLEPCLMCLGSSVLNRVNRIVYGCNDPLGGAANLDPQILTKWYVKKWPMIEGGLLREESYTLLADYMSEKSEIWGDALQVFRKMRESWS